MAKLMLSHISFNKKILKKEEKRCIYIAEMQLCGNGLSPPNADAALEIK